MKILHLSWDTKIPGIGGSTHEWNIAKAFKRLKNNVRIVCEWDYDKKVSDELDGISIRRVYWRTGRKIIDPVILLLKMLSNSFYQIINFSPDIVYERYRIMGGVGVVIGKLFKKRTILEVNDPTVDAPYIEGRIGLFTKLLASLWERFVFACTDKIVTHHEAMVKRANQKKVLITNNGVDTEEFNPEKFKRTKWDDRFVCLFVGSFAEWQGINTIIEAADKLSKYRKILFVFAGEENESKKNTVFLGKVDYNKIPELIANSDACLYTPDTENYKPMKLLGFYFSPLKLFEYMSMAKPVIVSDAGNLRKLIKNGVNGYRIKVNDSDELVEKILRLYKNKKLVKKMGENNRRECLKKFSWNKIAKEILK
ncbi:MAG: glycosyltransferase family 4 protein [Nanoarchaeota archaeon]|nr:glycosyltransferase family 4 protein [Nanoarchaeota archaeon]